MKENVRFYKCPICGNNETRFPYIPGSVLYAYCNKHGLWKGGLSRNENKSKGSF